MASSALDEKNSDEKVVNLATLVVHEGLTLMSVASAESCTEVLLRVLLPQYRGLEVLLGS